MAGGRPTKYKKEFCKQVIAHMEQGLSFDTFAGVLRVNPDSLYEWLKRYPEFSEAKKVGSALRNLLVERTYVASTLNPTKYKVNTAQLIYWTKNTLGWSDKVEHSADKDAPIIQLKYKLDGE